MIQMKSLSHCRHGFCNIDKYPCLCIERNNIDFIYLFSCLCTKTIFNYLRVAVYVLVFACINATVFFAFCFKVTFSKQRNYIVFHITRIYQQSVV